MEHTLPTQVIHAQTVQKDTSMYYMYSKGWLMLSSIYMYIFFSNCEIIFTFAFLSMKVVMVMLVITVLDVNQEAVFIYRVIVNYILYCVKGVHMMA